MFVKILKNYFLQHTFSAPDGCHKLQKGARTGENTSAIFRGGGQLVLHCGKGELA
jgi:hypothetical protein